jgi:hypothetical protein
MGWGLAGMYRKFAGQKAARLTVMMTSGFRKKRADSRQV